MKHHLRAEGEAGVLWQMRDLQTNPRARKTLEEAGLISLMLHIQLRRKIDTVKAQVPMAPPSSYRIQLSRTHLTLLRNARVDLDLLERLWEEVSSRLTLLTRRRSPWFKNLKSNRGRSSLKKQKGSIVIDSFLKLVSNLRIARQASLIEKISPQWV